MQKTILVTGATDGIGLETAKMLVAQGHIVLVHGRNPAKLEHAVEQLSAEPGATPVETYIADMSRLADVETLAGEVAKKHDRLDALINNAGVLRTSEPATSDGLDVRFVVNAIAPYLLTRRLLPLLGTAGRVVNVSSAAQAPVDLAAFSGSTGMADMEAYSQSKLAITMWSREMAEELGDGGPVVVAVNPGSLLGSKMVKEGFGIAGGDIAIGADILIRAALSDEFETATGKYFDNDSGQFAPPHPDALDRQKSREVVRAMEAVLSRMA